MAAKSKKQEAKVFKFKATNPNNVIIFQLPMVDDKPNPVMIGRTPVECPKTPEVIEKLNQKLIEQV